MRAFFALALEPPIVAALAECRNAILDADPSWRGEKWVADHNLHITAHFLGDVPEASLANVLDAARSALADVPAFHLAFGTIVAAPRQRAASMLWATPAVGNESLASSHTASQRCFQGRRATLQTCRRAPIGVPGCFAHT